MALTSPGVQVSVINESFYTPAEPGTTPIIFVATQQNKANPGRTGIAPGTLAANAGRVYLVSSQRELAETFGDPLFYTDASNNPIHGSEQNEYGLQAAYSYLGVANRAYIVRADVDLAAITASATPTAGDPTNGSYWFDTNDSFYGVFEWNGAVATTTSGQSFSNKVPAIITDITKVVDFAGGDYTPKGSVGSLADYVIVAVTNVNRLWYKSSGYGTDHAATKGSWVEAGSANWKASHAVTTGTSTGSIPQGASMVFSLTADSSGTQYEVISTGLTIASLADDINGTTALVAAGITAQAVNNKLAIYYTGDVVEIYGDDALFTALGMLQGQYYAPSVQISSHTNVPEYKVSDVNPRPTGSIWIKTTTPNLGANWLVKKYSSDTESWATTPAPIYATNHAAIYGLDSTTGGTSIAEGALYIQSNIAEDASPLGTFKIFRKNATGATTITSTKVISSTIPSGTYSFIVRESISGQAALGTATTVAFTATGAVSDADVVANAINSAGFTNVTASVDSQNRIVISHSLGGDIRFTDITDQILDNLFTVYDSTNPTSTVNFYTAPSGDADNYVASLWRVLTYTASELEPTTTPAEGALWYSSVVDEVDIMYHNGTTWVGYKDSTALPLTDINGPIVAASEPTENSTGDALVTGDIWISTANIDSYPGIYRRSSAGKWVLLDKTDQTTENGVLFADARYNTAGANSNEAGDIADLLDSNYLDPDAPDPALYPRGIILFNTRRSGFNIKRFERNWINTELVNTRFGDESMATYYANRWVTESANNADGSGAFGRVAQRKVVVQALQSMVNSNDDIRDDETRLFNLIATPGYPELIGEMITLNNDRGLTAFVVGDSPMRLQPNTTAISDWASNVNLAVEDNDLGLVSRDEYLGVYYPSGFTSDNAGNNIVVPASHMALRTIALNDQVAYPWFAPAGTRRGGVTNATAAGYISSEGEFVSIALNEGQRDTLYQNSVNPITFLNGSGLVVFGQKTRARGTSALDRVNVARLVIYLRSQLKTLAKPYIFEPNDKITRDEIKQQVESLMVELIGLRAIYDYLVVCDETNNTPSRIDRNELYVDIAIEPVKAVEFIYIPLRLKNTGEIAGL
jgi:hypothetical protein